MPSALRGTAWIFAIPAVACLVVYMVFEVAGYPRLLPAVMLLLTALAFAYYIFRRGRRCPQCGSPLLERHVYVHSSATTFRLKRECQQCEVLWDLGEREHAD